MYDRYAAALEAILFAAGKKVPFSKIISALSLDKEEALNILESIVENYNLDELRGLKIVKLEDSYQLVTKERYFDEIKEALSEVKLGGLSPAALETLAVIAYNQPVTRAFIEQIRGVDSSAVVSKLTEKGLGAESGKRDAPGRPFLYVVTSEFLRVFGISSLDELPHVEEIKQGSAENMKTSELPDQIPLLGV